ncbi:MAG TPA: plasmid pRiA4b ORF-3 family protein [Iamia sp.]|jgi:hypothetical protein|nr:plasmid pRiA4b ORF-3 family protein [Iamia sp.]
MAGSPLVCTLEVTLEGVQPPVWRRLEVPARASLADVHRAIQEAFGWADAHLHEFEADGIVYSEVDAELGTPARDEHTAVLGEVASLGATFRYTYDFGDGWEHAIRVEHITAAAEGERYPRCTGGSRACPPEDVGGPWGYGELLDVLADPGNDRHGELVEWLGGPFDPELFDRVAADAALTPIRAVAGGRPPAPRRLDEPAAGAIGLDLSSVGEEVARSTIDALLDRFATWLAHHPGHAGASVDDAALALEWKWGRADGDLGRWVRLHVDDLLLGELPARLGASTEQARTVPGSLASLFAFLDDEGLLDPAGDPADELVTRARALERSFLDAMADPVRFGMGKRLSEAMGLSDAGDLSQEDLDAAMDRFNALSHEERGAILGLDDGAAPGREQDRPVVPLPPRDLPSPDEMDAQADGVVLLQRVDALVLGLGPKGVSLTNAGNLKLADGRRLVALLGLDDPVDLVRTTADLPVLFGVVEVALLAGAVQSTGNRLLPVAGWAQRRAGDRWGAVVDGLLEVGVATMAFGSRVPHPAQLAEEGDSASLYLLAMLWMSEEPLAEDTLGSMLVEGLDIGMVPPSVLRFGRDLLERSSRARADDAVASLLDAGMVEVDADGIHLRTGGDRLAVPWLGDIGFQATLTEDLVALGASDLLDQLVDADVGVTAEVAKAWLEGGADRAASLVAAAVLRPDPERVLIALALLEHGGADAIAAVRAARDSSIGPSAWLWLVDRGEADPDDAPEGTLAEAGVVTLLALLDAGSAADVVENLLGQVPVADHHGLLEHLATAQHPRTAELLEQIGRHHPDKATGKHARKLAHRWRSAHGADRR